MDAEAVLRGLAGYTALAVEAAAVLIIGYGALEALVHVARDVARGNTPAGWRKSIFVRLGVWLLLGLQFALAADIVRSVISPTWNDIGQLAAIAVIRTFLNYFLEKDLDEFFSGAAPERS
jgi:uncharacterized membrane protein